MKNKTGPTKSCMSETELACLAEQGHVTAFAALFDFHKAAVYSLCLQTTNSVPDAEGLTCDIFLDVFRNLGTCLKDDKEKTEGTDFSARLHSAAVNRLQMHERRMRVSASFLDQLVELAVEPVSSHRAPTRFARMRARIRDARNQNSWISVWTRFARPRQEAKVLS
jgi:DNA-directed RNA polymerase specialized sigma24 family protein